MTPFHNKISKALPLLASMAWFAGCSDTEPVELPADGENAIVRISAALRSHTVESRDIDDSASPTETEEKAESVFDVNFDDDSRLFVSQMTEGSNPFISSDRIFRYRYFDEGEETEWTDPPEGLGGFNFTAADLTNPLEWKDIKAAGSYQNGYALFALYFPVDHSIRYNVEEDQSSLPNLMKSDVLGAYHSTSALFTRIKFNLFHLMVYLKITVFVPIYDETSKTGYFSDGLQSATVQDAYKDFTIDWGTIRSSDTEGPVTLYNPTADKYNISMYSHSEGEGLTGRQIEIKYKEFIPADYPEQPITGEYDKVSVHNFSVIIPAQPPEFAQSNFFKFLFKNPSGEIRTYYFNYSQFASETNRELQMNQGTLQHFNLYLPRKGNQAILMDASVIKWDDYFTELPLTPEEPEIPE